jgi:hypothetical protein
MTDRAIRVLVILCSWPRGRERIRRNDR